MYDVNLGQCCLNTVSVQLSPFHVRGVFIYQLLEVIIVCSQLHILV